MILWCDAAHGPEENMRRDAALLAACAPGPGARAALPVLRLFRFDPPGITLGRAQDPAQELDLARCRSDSVPWAVRPTGGRAIFHAREWTYSFAAPIVDPEWGGGAGRAYEHISRLVVASLRRLGVPAALAPGVRGPTGPRARNVAPPCFASTARHEIVLDGRKLVGSAQRRTARALLQQGSVLLSDDHLRLADYLPLPEAERERVRAELRGAATHAGTWLGDDAPLERWGESLLAELPPGTRRVDGERGLTLLAGA